MFDPCPPARPRHLHPVTGAPRPVRTEPIRWSSSEVHALIRRFFASPFGMAQSDQERHDLLGEIVEVAVRVGGDPTRWDDRLVTAVLVAEMPHQPHLAGRDRRRVPDLLRGFIGFCAAEQGLDGDDAHDAHDALAMVAHWSEGWNQQEIPAFDPWVAERRVLDELRVEVGTIELLWSLDTHPLPDEPFDERAVPRAAMAAFDEVLTLVDGARAVLVDPEVCIAARRLTARVAVGDATVVVRQPNRAVSAAVLVWLAARGNDAFGAGRARVRDLMGHLGLPQASPAGWATPYVRAAGLRAYGPRQRLTLGPELLTSTYRRSIIERRDHCQRVIGDDDRRSDVLQIAHAAGGDPGAPSTGQRAAPPRRAR